MQFMIPLDRAILALSRALIILFLYEVLAPQHVTEYPYPNSKMVKISPDPIFGISSVIFLAPVLLAKDR